MIASPLERIKLIAQLTADNRLKATDKHVVALLLGEYVNSDDGLCFPSYNTIARKLGIHRVTAINSVKRLVALGIVVKVATGNNKRQSNTYRFTGTSSASATNCVSTSSARAIELVAPALPQLVAPALPEQGNRNKVMEHEKINSASRMNADWRVSEEDRDWAKDKSYTWDQVEEAAKEFRLWYMAKGKNVKCDAKGWSKKWREWISKEKPLHVDQFGNPIEVDVFPDDDELLMEIGREIDRMANDLRTTNPTPNEAAKVIEKIAEKFRKMQCIEMSRAA
jgi:DNA-binding Lrp family transcriptional regulator